MSQFVFCEPCVSKVKAEVSKDSGAKRPTEPKIAKTEATEKPKEEPAQDKPAQAKRVAHCTCGMPLCICPADKPEVKAEDKKAAPKPQPTQTETKPVTTPHAAPSSFVGFATQSKPTNYDFSGNLNDQCRDAVKAGDDEGLLSLLKAGADPRYMDRTGMTLVHLAAMFNRFSTIQLLVQHGADIWVKNPSTHETAVDLAPPALQMKLQALQPKKEQ